MKLDCRAFAAVLSLTAASTLAMPRAGAEAPYGATSADSQAALEVRLLKGINSINLKPGQLRNIVQQLSRLAQAENSYRDKESQASAKVAARLKRVRTALLDGRTPDAEDQQAVNASMDPLKPELGKLELIRVETVTAVERELTREQIDKLRAQLGLPAGVPEGQGGFRAFGQIGAPVIQWNANPPAPDGAYLPAPTPLRLQFGAPDAPPGADAAGPDANAPRIHFAPNGRIMRIQRGRDGGADVERVTYVVQAAPDAPGEPVAVPPPPTPAEPVITLTPPVEAVPAPPAQNPDNGANNNALLNRIMAQLQRLQAQVDRLQRMNDVRGEFGLNKLRDLNGKPNAGMDMAQQEMMRAEKMLKDQLQAQAMPQIIINGQPMFGPGNPQGGAYVSDEEVVRQFFLQPDTLHVLRQKAAEQ